MPPKRPTSPRLRPPTATTERSNQEAAVTSSSTTVIPGEMGLAEGQPAFGLGEEKPNFGFDTTETPEGSGVTEGGGVQWAEVSVEEKAALREALLGWFREKQRKLPWRETRDPYPIWLSEMMLQQTRVETVIPYYHRFLEAFPTLEALASAPLQEVLALWSGLGYYRRARHLHQAAQAMQEKHRGQVPRGAAELLALPGIGRYTMGAIRSIAFGEVEALVDGNVYRIFSRIFLLTDPIGSTALDRASWALAQDLVQGEAPGEINQAFMELGATICLPKRPSCLLCPVRSWCRAVREGQVDSLPTAKASKPLKELPVLAAWITYAGKVLLRKRPDDGLFAQMWDFPLVEAGLPFDEDQPDLLRPLLDSLPLAASPSASPPLTAEHLLSHRRLRLFLYRFEPLVEPPPLLSEEEFCWIDPAFPPRLPFSSLTRSMLARLSG